ncbi:MAG: hypothetical protein HY370_00495 [Proteobacteria bacterium]|nr:hypothetical protein [Pseudomonadota bacterium]
MIASFPNMFFEQRDDSPAVLKLQGTPREKAEQILTCLFVMAGNRLYNEDFPRYGDPAHMTEELRYMIATAAEEITSMQDMVEEGRAADYAAIGAHLNLFAASLKRNPAVN